MWINDDPSQREDGEIFRDFEKLVHCHRFRGDLLLRLVILDLDF
jgi:hypothetical protein